MGILTFSKKNYQNPHPPTPRSGLTLIFPYNSLYTQAVAYTTYFELGKPVIFGTSHVSYRWGVKSAVKLSFGAGTAALRLNDINRRMQLLQSLVVYSLALFYGLLICLRLLWETIRKLKIPPAAKRRETRKQKISRGSEIFTYFWKCVSN